MLFCGAYTGVPELPEVETTVRGLNKKVLKRTFIDVWSDWKKIVHPVKYREAVISEKPKLFDRVKKSGSFELFREEIKGKKIIKIWRRAKNIIFDLSPTNFEVKEKKYGQ